MSFKPLLKISIFLIVYLILNILLFFYLSIDKKEKIDIYFQQKADILRSQFKATANAYNMLAGFLSEQINQNKDITSKVYRAYISEENIRDNIRKKLLKDLTPLYRLLKRYRFYYLTLYFPDGTVFLRLHQPYKYGDKIFKKNGIDSILQKKNSDTIEEKAGLKYIFPLYYKDKFIANLETYVSFNVLKQELSKLFGLEYEFIIKRDAISSGVFKLGKKLFIQSDFGREFFYEESSMKTDRRRVKNETIHKINLKIKNIAAQKMKEGKDFAVAVKAGDNYFIVTFITISSSFSKKDNKIGYLISYSKDTTFSVFESAFLHNLTMGNILIIVLLSFVFYIIHTKEKFQLLAVTDKLTGVYNRNKFYEVAQREMERSKRYKRPLSLIIMDIDYFKKINDTYGHDTGDYVLKTISKILKQGLRKSDYFFRWGGEEFIVLAPETTLYGAKQLAEKLRTMIENHKFDKIGRVTASFGVASYEMEKDADEIIKKADNALYTAKESGRNRVVLAE
ncbi:GGDEF domain-containing protein [Nitrosophilus alvini]|uniref:GGDEF domain-containing protein n=1 Tax=Nitrosophilus alvini TaxID=2714855 RepID=UPI00190D18CD|nr:diguanylate cyclase [Nitrosophilus alvini]